LPFGLRRPRTAAFADCDQHFLKHPLKPVEGMLGLPDVPGVNMAPDPDKIEEEEEVSV